MDWSLNYGQQRAVPRLEPSLLDRPSWIGHAWSLKNKELFQIALVDHPQGLNSWTVVLDRPSSIVHAWSLKNGEVFQKG